MAVIPVYQTVHPEVCLDQRIAEFEGSSQTATCFAIEYPYIQYYLSDEPSITLVGLVALDRVEGRVRICAGVAAQSPDLCRRLADANPGEPAAALAQFLNMAWLDLEGPLPLQPVHIPKPWGREIWYTGIEARGQSHFSSAGREVPLPWLLSLAPGRLVRGLERRLTLLKILDPVPEEVYGDLYFEMHEQKQEVYVVTHIDKCAWPQGRGGIRFGFDQRQRRDYPDDDSFREAYLQAVQNYESVRREIDRIFDGRRREQGLGPNEPVAADIVKQWQRDVPEELKRREESLRAAMERFAAIKPLQVGDVVKVPCYTPHSLLHGVRTVEFQTPVYERKILSFAQKVLTQSHWDTAAALNSLALEAPEQPPLVSLPGGEGAKVEQVVDFDDFEVRRVTLAPGAILSLEAEAAYAVAMSIQGAVTVSGWELEPEQAAVLPANLRRPALANRTDAPAIALLSLPK